jgi:exopolyphosphatase/guanosine-5'-triphosphate,3'-diphosphate pyrophosphatase
MPVSAEALAVIDVGSNSGRILVVRLNELGHLDVLETEGTPLRLVHELSISTTLGEPVVQRTVEALRGFQAIARGVGASKIIVVATAAVREASNGEAFVQRLRSETGLDVQIIAGDLEARYGFLGAVYGVPADDGVLVDIGGGSVQLAQFRNRTMEQSWSLPLGALRLSDRFLTSDPPSASELRRLEDYVRRSLKDADAPRLAADDVVVGTGGSIRNLAKLDRMRRDYPIPRLHGYFLGRRDVADLVTRLAQQTAAQRAQMPGLNVSRFDSIVGGAICLHVVLETLGTAGMLVSGHGLREGVALSQVWERLPSASEVRHGAVMTLAGRFASFDRRLANERVQAASALREALDPDVEPELVETLCFAATVLDVGRSIDFYSRHEHTVNIVRGADLSGFSHRAIALLGATIRLADKSSGGLKQWAPLLEPADQASLVRLGAILGLADAIARQTPPDVTEMPGCVRAADTVELSAPWLEPWPLQAAARRVQQVFAVQVRLNGR